jgi:hypothetical protein
MSDREEERGQQVTPLELFFDLVFCLRHHAGDELSLRESDGGWSPSRFAGAGRAVVGVGGLRVVDQSPRSGGRRRSSRRVRRDGSDARRVTLCAGCLRPRWCHVRRRLLRGARPPPRSLRGRRSRKPGPAANRRADRPRRHDRSWPLGNRRLPRRDQPVGALGRGTGDRLPRRAGRRHRRVEYLPRPLRRAQRASDHHCPRRVDICDRRRCNGNPARRRCDRSRPPRDRRRRGTVVVVLRLGSVRPQGSTGRGVGGPHARRSRETPIRTCTCRWSPASSCSRSG